MALLHKMALYFLDNSSTAWYGRISPVTLLAIVMATFAAAFILATAKAAPISRFLPGSAYLNGTHNTAHLALLIATGRNLAVYMHLLSGR